MITVMMSKNNLQDSLSLSYSIPKTPPKPSLGNNGIPYNRSTNHFREFPQFPQSHKLPEASNTETKSNFRILVANTMLGITEGRMS